MYKKVILLLLICILSLQMFPTQWITFMEEENKSTQFISLSTPEEDQEDEFGKDLKGKIFESDLMDFSHNPIWAHLVVHQFDIHTKTIDFSKEVICPPPNFI